MAALLQRGPLLARLSSSASGSRQDAHVRSQVARRRCAPLKANASAAHEGGEDLFSAPLGFATGEILRPRSGFDLSIPAAQYAPPPPRFQDVDPSTLLLKQRTIFLGSQVDDVSADMIISQLLLLDAQDPTQDIKLLINSPGGSVTAGMGIYDAMKLCKADVSTICFGLAASMGAFLLAAGTKGKRYAMPNSRIMIHQPLGGAGGSALDMVLQVREMLYHKVKLNKLMSRMTGQTYEQIELDTDRDNFLNPWEAKEYGLVDEVVGSDRQDLVAPIGDVLPPRKIGINRNWSIKEGREVRDLPGEQRLLEKSQNGAATTTATTS